MISEFIHLPEMKGVPDSRLHSISRHVCGKIRKCVHFWIIYIVHKKKYNIKLVLYSKVHEIEYNMFLYSVELNFGNITAIIASVVPFWKRLVNRLHFNSLFLPWPFSSYHKRSKIAVHS